MACSVDAAAEANTSFAGRSEYIWCVCVHGCVVCMGACMHVRVWGGDEGVDRIICLLGLPMQ